ncbi:hypothetical protein [Azospirillum sp. TSO35-2]|uniref:hypothetical protein n=1 Tax=Azospirillum sp. TSO35-2 TaxID=716796 RepID=UPI000D6107EB|nr:hypothetical protein [Azospirillum sp. TSO35-2]PWC35992.1 hypothetical protein TSO352_12460 [Azospirillum sp. TSO35-2]
MDPLYAAHQGPLGSPGTQFEPCADIALPHMFKEEMVRLARNLGVDRDTGKGQVLQFIGVGTDDGTSSICFGLAHVAAFRFGLRVLLVEADPPGYDRDLLTEGQSLEAARINTPAQGPLPQADAFQITSLWGGTKPEVVSATALRLHLMMRLRSSFDLILIDSNRSAFSPEGPLIASMATGVVLVINGHRGSVDLAAEVGQRLQAAGGHLRGVVLSRLP